MKRWSLLLVAAAVLALLALLVWKHPSRDGVDSTAQAPIEAPIQPSAMSDVNTDANVDGPKVDASPGSVDSGHTRAVVSVEGATLRIHVKLDGLTRRPRNFHLSMIDSYACDVELEDDSEFEFSASALAAGTYMLELTSDGVQNTRQIVEVKSSPRDQDVDLSARRKQRLRVRWSGINRSIQDELAAMPIREDRRVTLSVRATMQRPRPESSIESTSIASLSRTFDLHPRTNDTNMVDEAPQLSSRFPPNDPDAPPDTFGYLLLAEPLPLFVSVWIGGHLLDSDPIAAGAVACSFATPIAGVGDLRKSVSLCLVDDETGAPVRSTTIRALVDCDGEEPLRLTESSCLDDVNMRYLRNELMITGAEYAPMLCQVVTLPGIRTKLGEVRLSKARSVDVHIVDSAGAAVPDMQVRVCSLDYFQTSLRLVAFENPVTDRNGNAHVASVGRGAYVVLAQSADKMCAPRYLDTRVETKDKLELTAQHMVIVGIHVHPSPPPETTMCIRSRSNGMPALAQWIPRHGWTNALLVPGEYTVQLFEDGVASESVDLTVGDTSFIFDMTR